MLNKDLDLSVGKKIYVRPFNAGATVIQVFPLENRVRVKLDDGPIVLGPIDDCEEFIEPKYTVGDKFICSAGDYVTEVVKLSLNKKRKEFTYLCFDNDGFARAEHESRLNSYLPVKLKGKKVIAKAKAEKLLGNNVIIV